MANYKFVVQSTGKPFGPCEQIPESAWKIYSKHTSYTAARKKFDKLCANMQKYCGPSAWNNHYRVVPLVDTKMSCELHCMGYIDDHGITQICRNTLYATSEIVWPAMQPKPEYPIPEGWVNHFQCTECNNKEHNF